MDEATTRQAQMILLGNPQRSAVDRLLADTPERAAWLLKRQAMAQRLIIDELRYEAGTPDWLKRWCDR